MWRSGIISLVVVALCLCVVAAEQPAQVAPGDIAIMAVEEPGGLTLQSAADPNQTWDPAAHLAGGWTSVTLTSRTDRNSDVPARSLSVASSFTLTDPNGVLGLTRTPTGVMAMDQRADVVCSAAVARDRVYWPPLTIKTFVNGKWVSQLQPYTFSLNIPLDPNRVCPLMLTKLEWSTYALIPGTVKNVDIPFKVNSQWVDVVPGLQVLVDKATVTGSSFQYSTQIKLSPSKVTFWTAAAMFLIGDQKPTPAIVTKIDVLDAQGKSIQDQAGSGAFGSGGGYGGSGDNVTGSYTGNGSCSICGTAATIRFVVALNAYEKEIRFLLQNVPVPALWY